MACSPSGDSIQPGHPPSLIRVFLSAWRNHESLATHWTHSKDTNQTGRMPRLIWVFAGRTVILLVLSQGGSFDCNLFYYICYNFPYSMKEVSRPQFLCLQRDGWAVFGVLFFFHLVYPIFSNASSLGRRLDRLKYCGLGRYNPTVVVGYYWRNAR